jgi:alpha-D-ribose 1-methylphosphonate 5-triphosphate synthase subunit PhnH
MKLLSAVCADPETASFIVMPGDHDPDFIPRIGTLESPEYGATIILQVDQIGEGDSFGLSGPGIQGSRQVSARGLSHAWLMSRAKWAQEFPLGVDFILVDGKSVLAIPRTSKI